MTQNSPDNLLDKNSLEKEKLEQSCPSYSEALKYIKKKYFDFERHYVPNMNKYANNLLDEKIAYDNNPELAKIKDDPAKMKSYELKNNRDSKDNKINYIN